MDKNELRDRTMALAFDDAKVARRARSDHSARRTQAAADDVVHRWIQLRWDRRLGDSDIPRTMASRLLRCFCARLPCTGRLQTFRVPLSLACALLVPLVLVPLVLPPPRTRRRRTRSSASPHDVAPGLIIYWVSQAMFFAAGAGVFTLDYRRYAVPSELAIAELRETEVCS